MGRTVPSFRMQLGEIIVELSIFRRALRGEEKDAFDSLMNKARKHASSSTIAPTLEPMDAVFLSILIEQQMEIKSLRETQMFLLDIRYNSEKATITKWIKNGRDCKPVSEMYYPKIYISDKPGLQSLIASLPGLKEACFEEKSTWLGKEPEKVISATVEPNLVYEIASMLEAKGCSLYNIDLDPVRQYLLERGMFPMAKLGENALDDSQYAIDYEIP